VVNSDELKRFRHTAQHLLSGQAELQRPKRDFIEYGRVKQLDIGILKDKRYAPAESSAEGVIAKTILRKNLTAESNLAASWETQCVQ
jgi:hypothetical protein